MQRWCLFGDRTIRLKSVTFFRVGTARALRAFSNYRRSAGGVFRITIRMTSQLSEPTSVAISGWACGTFTYSPARR